MPPESTANVTGGLIAPEAKTAATKDIHHLAYIDAVRGWAILGVLCTHVPWHMVTSAGRLYLVFGAGLLGVELFFVASALTLAMSMNARKKEERRPLVNFALRRFFRIAPLFYLAIVFYTFFSAKTGQFHVPKQINWTSIWASFTFLHGLHPHYGGVVPGGWSVGVEMVFYALFPAIYLWCKSLGRTLVLWLGLFEISILSTDVLGHYYPDAMKMTDPPAAPFSYFWVPRHLPVFLAGLIAFQVLKRWRPEAQRSSSSVRSAVLLAVALVTYVWAAHFNRNMPDDIYLVLAGISFASFVLALAYRPWGFFVNRPLRLLGQLSFSMYITHWVVMTTLTPWVDRAVSPLFGFLNKPGGAVMVVCIAVITVLTAALSWFTYHWVEKPGIAAGKKLIAALA